MPPITNEGSTSVSADVTVVDSLTSIAIVAFYPLAREVLYRMTQPMAGAFAGFFVIGWLLVRIVFVVRILMHLLIWVASIPWRFLDFSCLAITEAGGERFRFG